MRAQSFFVRYHGRGLTKADVDSMSVDEVDAEAKRVYDQINKENEARKEAVARSKSGRR